MCRREAHGAGRQELDDDFSAADVGVKMWNGSARVVARNSSKSDLPNASTSHSSPGYNLGLGLSTAPFACTRFAHRPGGTPRD